MKTCIVCKEEKSFECFDSAGFTVSGEKRYDGRCKACKKIIAKANREKDYFKWYCVGKKSECKQKGISYDLSPEYLESIWTKECPVFGTELFRASEGMGSPKSAHLDRISPNRGYVKGNVAWISGRANRIKYDATPWELRAIADWMESATTIPLEKSTD